MIKSIYDELLEIKKTGEVRKILKFVGVRE